MHIYADEELSELKSSDISIADKLEALGKLEKRTHSKLKAIQALRTVGSTPTNPIFYDMA